MLNLSFKAQCLKKRLNRDNIFVILPLTITLCPQVQLFFHDKSIESLYGHLYLVFFNFTKDYLLNI